MQQKMVGVSGASLMCKTDNHKPQFKSRVLCEDAFRQQKHLEKDQGCV